ncbi:MAG TPA: hypothetical protein PLP98_03595, partial [Plasticicumulans sp.]|nr:hypothetical protein [Plasticicumulans sp.]
MISGFLAVLVFLISLAMSLPADAAGLEVREPSRMVVASSGVDVPDAFCKGLALAPKQVRVFFGVPMWQGRATLPDSFVIQSIVKT